MVAIAIGITALTAVTFGLLRRSTSPDPRVRAGPLRAFGARGGGAGREASRLRAALAVGQLVMATVLLVGAGLLIHSFARLLAVDRGYEPGKAVAFQLVFPPGHSIARKVEAIEGILSRLRAAPDTVAAGFSRHGILIGEQITIGTFVPHGRPSTR